MSNQSKYFTFIILTLSLVVIGFGIFIFLPGISAINKPTGQVLGIKEAQAPEINPDQDDLSKIDFKNSTNFVELQKKLDKQNKVLLKLPALIQGQKVERDADSFFIPCGNGQMNAVRPEFSNGISAILNNDKFLSNEDVKKYLILSQTNSDYSCNLTKFDIAKILEKIEIRPITKEFKVQEVTDIISDKNVDYILAGDCLKNGITFEQTQKFTLPCTLWSLPHSDIYPEIVSSELRNWFPNGDISFYKPEIEEESSDIPFKLVNIDAIKRDANIFYLKNSELKLVDLKEVTDLQKFSLQNTNRFYILPVSELKNYFYRVNQLPILPLDKKYRNLEIPKQSINCFWSNTSLNEFWYKDIVIEFPLTRNNPCNIAEMMATQKVKGLRISEDEFKSGDAWYLDKNAFDLNENIFDTLKSLGYKDQDPKEICSLAAKDKQYFERQICPFNISNLKEFEELGTKLETTSNGKAGKWHIQSVEQGQYIYRVYVQTNANGLWVYWFRLKNDGEANVNEKRIELNNVMQKVVLR